MRNLRLLCICPYAGLYNLMSNLAAQRSDVELVVRMGNLEEGLKALQDAQESHFDAILSRGGTTEAIRQHCRIPIYDITPSVYDVMRTIRLAQEMEEAFAVVGFPSILKPAQMMCDILQYTTPIYTIHSSQECAALCAELRDSGIRMVVGDMISVACAQQSGMRGLLIVSGIESAEATIETVKETYRYYDSTGQDAKLFSDILHAQNEKYIAYSPRGDISFSTAGDLPNDVSTILQHQISNVITQGTLKIVHTSGSDVLTVSGQKIHSGSKDYCLYRLSHDIDGALLGNPGIQFLSSESDLPHCNPLEYYLGGSETSAELLSACERIAPQSAPVLITGGRGTGKDRFAYYIYTQSPLRCSTFVFIDTASLGQREWSYLLESYNSPLTGNGLSIYFQRIDEASAEFQKHMQLYLKNSHTSRTNRLYFSFSTERLRGSSRELFLFLSETMHSLHLRIPDLSQRKADIPTLVGLYINALNVQYGTQVIGLTRSAMLLLQNYSWKRNIDQLIQTIHTLVINANSSYISEDQVKAALSMEKHTPASLDEALNLHQTLDDIIRDVVIRVCEEEQMNQTQAAKRLGISRSTLWRMLK